MLKKNYLMLSLWMISFSAFGQGFFALGEGLNGEVRFIQSAGNYGIVVGGAFTNVGGLWDADYLARWDGEKWFPYHLPAPNGPVNDVFSDIIAGDFTKPYAYLMWLDGDGVWHPFNHGINGPVHDIEAMHNALTNTSTHYAIGDFDGKIAKSTNGGSWQPLGGGVTGKVNVFKVVNEDLYVGGLFTPQGSSQRSFDQWKNGAWQNIPQPEDILEVHDMAFLGNDLYLTGYPADFCQGEMHETILKWDGEQYDTFPPLAGCWVASEICFYQNRILVDAIDSLGGEALWVWDRGDKRWEGPLTSLPGASTDQINTVIANQNKIYIGGSFNDLELPEGDNIIGWDPDLVSSNTEANALHFPITVYPNPATDFISVELRHELNNGSVLTLYDCSGKVVLQQILNDTRIDVSSLSPGVYIVEVRSAESWHVGKVIIK